MNTIPGLEDLVRNLVVNQRRTHKFVSEILQSTYPSLSGLSARSVRRFCRQHAIHGTSRLTDNDIDNCVRGSIRKVI